MPFFIFIFPRGLVVMKRSVYLLALTSSLAFSCFAASDPLLGKWKTIDDKTGYSLADVEIQKDKNNLYRAIILSTREIPGATKIENCTKCDGVNKNQPIIGMTTLSHLKADETQGNTYIQGQLLDPLSGLRYDAQARLSNNGKHLRIRGTSTENGGGRNIIWVKY